LSAGEGGSEGQKQEGGESEGAEKVAAQGAEGGHGFSIIYRQGFGC